jgi:hypothetical protein
MSDVNEREHEPREPSWLRLASDASAQPEPGTLARVRARIAARGDAPGWLAWLARPATLAASAALLVLSAWAGSAWVSAGAVDRGSDTATLGSLLGEDGSLGLPVDADDTATPRADSEGVVP